MQTFELYGAAWLLYIFMGLILLALINYKTKNLSWHLRLLIISLLAVGAFTPDTVVNADTFAPLIVAALLKAEVEGSGAIIAGLLRLLIIWGIVFFTSLAMRHFWQARKQKDTPNETTS